MLRPKRLIAARPASAPDPSAANPLRAWQRAFCDYTLTRGLSEATARLRERALNDFIRWGDERGLRHPAEVTRPVLQRYQRHLYLYRKSQWPAPGPHHPDHHAVPTGGLLQVADP